MQTQIHPETLKAAERKRYCPTCAEVKDPDKLEVRNHNIAWGDGDVHCKDCGAFIRRWEAG
jgi:hypothetical protein